MKKVKLTEEQILKIVFDTIDEFHSRTCFWTHTKNLKQTIKDRINNIEVKVNHKNPMPKKE